MILTRVISDLPFINCFYNTIIHMKKLTIIINPSSGQPLPVIPQISDFAEQSRFSWEILTTRKQGDASLFAKQALEKKADAVVVYGGDGTVMEVAASLMNTETPLYIIPGGTANILAKELQIPLMTEQALKLLTNPETNIKRIDMGTVNKKPFILRVNSGVLADMIIEADPNAKVSFGQLAYSFSAVQQFANTQSIQYSITIDGKTERLQGITLTIANSGNIGFSGVSFTPDIKVDDGLLDILVLRENTIGSLAGVITGAVINRTIHEQLAHWRVKKATISMHPGQSVLRDDVMLKETTLEIETVPSAISIATPL